MTVTLNQIRQYLRRSLWRKALTRSRRSAHGFGVEILETRELLSGKRSSDTLGDSDGGNDADGAGSGGQAAPQQGSDQGTGNCQCECCGGRRRHVHGFPLPTTTPSGTGTVSGAAPFNLDQTFQLASRPSATKTIYLDFNGHTTSGTWWNSSFNNGADFTTPAFSTDGSASFSDAELERIQYIWMRVAEDFAPFDVNVTTMDLGTAAITRSGSGDQNYGVRVVIGGAYSDWYESSAGGVAYLNTFGESIDMGVFVFSQNLGNGEKNIAEAVSHEAGHALGLSHDGTSSTGYYSGHGSGATGWAPIMGVGYYQQLTQWSRGQYPGANQTQDDLAIITSNNGFGYRADDYGNSLAAASLLDGPLSGGSKTINSAGVIERNTDQDWFRFTTTGGTVSLNFAGVARGTNLDISVSLYDASGTLLQTVNPADDVSASLSAVLADGTYYVMIDGVGARSLSDGYSDYGSLGQYFVTGTIPDDGTGSDGGGGGGGGGTNPPPAGTASIGGRVWHDADGDGRTDVGDVNLSGVTVYIDANNNGIFDSLSEQSATTGSDGRYSLTGLAAGSYRIQMIAPAGFVQIFPRQGTVRTVSVSSGATNSSTDFRAAQPGVIANLGSSATYVARSTGVVLAPTGTFSDADSATFASFQLTVQITGAADRNDRLSIRNQGRTFGLVGVSGSAVYYSGVRVASVSGGSGAGKLTITFNGSATSAAIQAILRNISYRSTSTAPPLSARTVTFLMTEPSGAVSSPVTKSILLVAAGSV